MTTMISEVYNALKAAGAPEDKATAAATALANYENRFNKIEADLVLLKWITTANLAVVTAIMVRTFF